MVAQATRVYTVGPADTVGIIGDVYHRTKHEVYLYPCAIYGNLSRVEINSFKQLSNLYGPVRVQLSTLYSIYKIILGHVEI